jgi:hypothetical protein
VKEVIIITTKKTEKSLVEITEEEFTTNVWSAIDQYNDQIRELQEGQREFYKLWRNYLIDRNNHKNDLVFYLRDKEALMYKRIKKPSIGYKRNDEK